RQCRGADVAVVAQESPFTLGVRRITRDTNRRALAACPAVDPALPLALPRLLTNVADDESKRSE
ncbi:MAG TPA: hypothetical protein VGC70_00685, partial [Burkholderiales bacterium]